MVLVPVQAVPFTDLVAVWNQAMGQSFPLREKLLRQHMADLNFLPEASFAAVKDGRTVGFALAKQNRENMGILVPRIGYISAIAVDPSRQRQGIGSQLLGAVRRQLEEQKVTRISLGGDTYHLFPGIPEEVPAGITFFARHGAVLADGRSVDLMRDITDYAHPASVIATLEREPVQFRTATADDLPSLIQFLSQEFPGRWTYERCKFLYAGGDPSDIMLGVEHGRIVAFCQMYTPQSIGIGPSVYWAPLLGDHYGGLGPLGAAKSVRGRGLGLAVVAETVAELKRQGVQRMAIDWTTLVDFYGLLGFVPWKRYIPAHFAL